MKKHGFACFVFSLLLLTQSTQAIPADFGDIILGFRASGGMGADTNLEVNLGPASQFYGAAAGSTAVLTGLSVTDLVSTYGDDWNTRSDLFWGIAGTTGAGAVNGVPARTIWASRPETTPGTASTPWPRALAISLQNASQAIAAMYKDAPGSIDKFNATTNSATTAKVIAGETGSWSVQELLAPNVSFRYFNPGVSNSMDTFPGAGSSYDSTGYTVLDLWEVRPGTSGTPSTLLGGIGLNSAGKLVFSTDVSKFGSSAPVQLGIPTIVRNPAGSITVSLTNAPPGNYILERSTALTTGTWSDLLTQSPTAGTLTFTDSSPPLPRGFYRIKTAP